MKRIVICADGTWNERDRIDEKTGRRHPTNVTKVARAVLPQAADGTAQVVYYHEGVGTGGWLDKFTGGAFGEGIEANIRALYRFIVYNYTEGDELYFFGFIRGAFTVRTLAGFMNYVKLIGKDDDYYVPEIYACYENDKKEGSPEWTKAFHNVKSTRPCPPIRFVGVWDTVGALGAPGLIGQVFNKDKYKYHKTGLMNSSIQNAFHALAIDERRKPFVPDMWQKPAEWAGQLEQAWFAGVHSNVGGSYAPDLYVSSFVGLAPASAPRLLVAVMIDEPGGDEYYGGVVAAPVFSAVMSEALRMRAVPPDAPIAPLHPIEAAPEVREEV